MKNNFSICSILISANIFLQLGVGSALGAEATVNRLLAESIPSPPCDVNDPTGTPLNLRSKPNGKIIARVKNGLIVEPTDSPIRGRWREIRVRVGNKQVVGWVLSAYLACQ